MNLNESKFLEELRQIDKEIKSARLEFCRPRAVPNEPTPEQKVEIEKATKEREWTLHTSIYEASKRLSYLLSLVENDTFGMVMDELYPLLRKVYPVMTKMLQDNVIKSSDKFYTTIGKYTPIPPSSGEEEHNTEVEK